MKLKFLLFAILLPFVLFAQFKNDNVLYKTVFPQDLCKELQQNKGYLLLDVRSKGEYADTSSSAVYNLGHLQNAININISELGGRISEISSYKDKPVYIYCSHSQRSRRASKMLSDSGFTNIINVNGGLTAIRRLPQDNCANKFVVTNVGYQVIAATELCKKFSMPNSIYMLDVRKDSAFRHIDLRANVNAMGTFKSSTNIPIDQLEKRMSEIPTDKEIIITDLFGDDAAKAASILVSKGYKNISVLLEGVERMHYSDSKELACLVGQYNSSVKYKILSTPDFKRLIESDPGFLALDVRSVDEFSNKHKDYWRNIGHMKNAVNIPLATLETGMKEIEAYKNKPVLVYSFSANRDAHEAANLLLKNGFTNVSVLIGGLFNVRWTAGNIDGYTSLNNYVEGVPAENL